MFICRNFFAGIGIAVSVLLITLFYLSSFNQWVPTGIDDADIAMTYARNLANGFGIVFTPGYEKVEGSTSALWTLIMSLAYMGGSGFEWLLVGLCALLTAGSVWQFYMIFTQLFSKESALPPLLTSLFAIWMLVLPGYYAWNIITLMDVTLWSFLIAWGARLTVDYIVNGFKRRYLLEFSVCILLLVLTRPEAMLLAPFFILLWAIVALLKSRRSEALAMLIPGTIFTLTLSGLLIFRKLYFGFPFPNTFYAKVQVDIFSNIIDGIKYDSKFLIDNLLVSSLLLFFAIATVAQLKTLATSYKSEKILSLLAINSIVIFGFFLPLLVGGDHFASSRFLQPFVPLIIFTPLSIVESACGELNQWLLPAHRKLGMFALIIAISGTAFRSYDSSNALKGEFRLAEWGREAGVTLNTAFPNSMPSIGVTAAGGVAYTYKGRTLDLLGLNWSEMAHGLKDRRGYRGHDGFSTPIFWKHSPDLVLPFVSSRAPVNPELSDKFDKIILNGLQDSIAFRERYRAGYIKVNEKYLVSYYRAEWLESSPDGPLITVIPWD